MLAALAACGLSSFAGAALATGAAQASTLPTLTIALTQSSATISGPIAAGGVNIISTDTGVKEASVILFLLKPGVSVAEFEAFTKSKQVRDPNYADKFGTIAFDTEANQGQSRETQTTLQPGQYALMVGVGEGQPTVRTSFTVAASAAPVALPTPQATIKSIEFGFRGPSTLHDGELVRFENEGFLVHMDIALQVRSAKAAKRLIALMLAGKEKQAGKLIVGAATFDGPLSTGAYQQETITAKPGIYVEACFMDTQDGRGHTLLGMERVIHIVK
jgi:uncharacterized cupredoxin-like copper-binding protein